MSDYRSGREAGRPGRAEKEKKQKKTIIILVIILAVVIIGGGLLVYYLLLNNRDDRAYEREVAAKLGQLEGKTPEEIQAELDRVIEEGMFHVAINAEPVFQDGSAEGNLEIENVPNNHYLMRVEITRDDTGELIYSTKYIEPNSHIQRVALDTVLEKGDYPCTVVFYAYEPGSLTQMGQVTTRINLHVLN